MLMKKIKTKNSDTQFLYNDYKEFLEQSISDIESIIRELDAKFLNNTNQKIPHEIQFDSVPFYKKLKSAQKEARLASSFIKNC